MNYKRQKPKDKKSTTEWGTPKEYQHAFEHPAIGMPAKKPSWYCKKLKGKHDFKYNSTSQYSWDKDHATINYICSGCGKNKCKSVKIDSAEYRSA